MRRFEAWCHLLLLDAWQRAGMFKEPNISATVAGIAKQNMEARGASATRHARMIQAALDILVSSGLLRRGSVSMCSPSAQMAFGAFMTEIQGDICCSVQAVVTAAIPASPVSAKPSIRSTACAAVWETLSLCLQEG